ncbi:MAG: tetratricopeptide repeat protein [Chlorobi bacterium]|nr:tetratricopeptide repeat protein [Chlorobiota bacterium]
MKKHNQSQNEFERIERYLTGRMDNKEKLDFEASLKTDPLLSKQTEEVRALLHAIEEKKLREKLDDFHEELTAGERRVMSVRPFQKYIIAASVALLIGLGIWLLSVRKTPDEKLFSQYFKPDPGLITPMSTTSDYEFYRGMVDYKQGKYKPAINRWNRLIEKKPDNDTLNFYLGVSYLAGGNSKKATDFLSKAVKYPNSILINEAWYYLGLAYLKEGNSREAIRSFRKSDLEESKLILKEMEE